MLKHVDGALQVIDQGGPLIWADTTDELRLGTLPTWQGIVERLAALTGQAGHPNSPVVIALRKNEASVKQGLQVAGQGRAVQNQRLCQFRN